MYTYLDAERGHDKIDVLYMYTTKEKGEGALHTIYRHCTAGYISGSGGRGVGGSIPPLAEFYPPWKVIISHTH